MAKKELTCIYLSYLLLASGVGCSAHERDVDAPNQSANHDLGVIEIPAEVVDPAAPDSDVCRLTINVVDDFSGDSIPALVRVTNLESGKHLKLAEGFHRGMNWYSLAKRTSVRLPRTKVQVEAIRGLETFRVARKWDLSTLGTATVKLPLAKFYDSKFRSWYSGNAHLHLSKMTRADADRYLQTVGASDELDFTFLSYLRRVPDEKDYISNEIVEESFTSNSLQRLSTDGRQFANGEELRHNFGRDGEGFGHAMLLDLPELIRPVSIGPGLMATGTDGVPLQQGIRKAIDSHATVVWCHNALGYEDIPNWIEGTIHAQNIFDGSSRGGYEDTFYRYLDIGLHVPFSTGTDWQMYDLARVYVPVYSELTTASWLASLRQGQSYITNGPVLEMETERASIGETLKFVSPNQVTVVGRGLGRVDFGGLELIYNGKVVHRVKSTADEGCYRADLRYVLDVPEPGWFAMRIPRNVGKSELGHPLFAHTSPIYCEIADQTIFRVETARGLIEEMQESIKAIEQNAVFADDQQRKAVLSVYQNAIEKLETRIRDARESDR